MDKIILTTGILFYFVGILLMNRSKKSFSNDAIIDYEKNIKPNFFKFFLLALSPMLLILIALYTDYLPILDYFTIIIFITFCIDLFAFYRLRSSIMASANRMELAKFPMYFGTVIFGKIITLIGLKLYLEQLLTPSR